MVQPFNVCLDRMTILGTIKDIEAFKKYISTDIEVDFEKDFGTYMYDYKGTIKKTTLKESAFFQFNSKEKNVRFEFNPQYYINNKISYDRFMKHIENKYFSRIDIAFDFDINLFNYKIVDNVPNRIKTHVFGSRNKMETLYLGTRKSPLSICIYDKKKEQEQKGNLSSYNNWNRIEVRIQTSKAIRDALNDWDNYNPFHNIQLIQDVPREACKSFKQWVIIKEIINNPNSLLELSVNTRKNYKDKIASISSISIELTKIWEEKKPCILKQIQNFLD